MTTPLDGARRHIANDRAPIPVPFKAKEPVVKEWQKLRITAETAVDYFDGRPQNVGVLPGAPSGVQVVVDLDAGGGGRGALPAAGYPLPRRPRR